MRPSLGRPALASLPLLLFLPGAHAQEPTDSIAWRTDFAAARAEAAQQRTPLFVVFRCER